MSEILRGTLGPIRLAGLLQLAESEGVTGWMGIGTVGGIALSQGEVVQASFGASLGQQALWELFLESRGTFRLETWDTAPGAPLGAMLPLIMEGCRLADEWERVGDAVPVWTAPEPPTKEVLVTLNLDGRSTVAQLAARAAVARIAAIDPLLHAMEQGLVRLDGHQPSEVAARPVAHVDYYDAMDRGRALLRDGALEEAAQAFSDALRARPGDRLARSQLARTR